MKFVKTAVLLLGLSMIGASLCACSNEPEPVSSEINIISTQAQNSGVTNATESAKAFVFDYNDFVIGTTVDESKMPDDIEVIETFSCGGVGLATVYKTPSFEVELRPGSQIITQVRFNDDTVYTPEGIHIGSTIDEVKSAYGDSPLMETSAAIKYGIDSYELQFNFDEATGKITYIMYLESFN
ncbi:MAG: hypothetical protein IKF09_07115 [Clostridiales bacterium]|nr:hypothetical protein [Clostridiales bacterium]